MGPAGLTVVIVREDLIGRADAKTPSMLDYKTYADNDSMFNTPPTYAIYICGLVLQWLEEEIGGLDQMKTINEKRRLYFMRRWISQSCLNHQSQRKIVQ